MSLKSAPYFWVECDGCGEKSTEGGDFSAWSDEMCKRHRAEWEVAHG